MKVIVIDLLLMKYAQLQPRFLVDIKCFLC